jgi:multidrug efflux pump
LRPVLMTSAATVFGHLPLVFVSGPGAEARNSIGTILVAGMIVGTLFTLFIVPVFYSLIAAQRGPSSAYEAMRHKMRSPAQAESAAGIT